MSATYNWAYKPGVPNKYGIVINPSADNVRPSNAYYVGLFGNDTTGNGSRQLPYRTLGKVASLITTDIQIVIIGSGTYRETGVNFTKTRGVLIGDGDVTLDISFAISPYIGANSILYNIKIIGNGNSIVGSQGGSLNCTDCSFDGCSLFFWFGPVLTRCIFSNCYAEIGLASLSGSLDAAVTNCTFVNCGNIFVSNRQLTSPHSDTFNIFSHCNITIDSKTANVTYSLFHNCNFRYGGENAGGAVYPTIPAGFANYATIAALRAGYTIAYPDAVNPFSNCIFADPKFNNRDIGDFSLAFDSPAKNLSYFGTYAGARSIAQSLKIRLVEANGDFDFSTTENVTIADNSITLTNPALDGVIETKVIENTLGRQLKSIPILGFNADRNGQYIDSIADLSPVTKASGDTLVIPASYLVELSSVTYNAAVYTAGQRFTTVTGQTTFTTATGGVVREISEAPQRHTIEMKLSDAQPFTTEAFNHFEPGISPTTNNAGDSRTGAILRGNGDPAYVRGDTVEFPVNSKYIKIRFTIRANNLKP